MINPLNPKSDQHLISPFINATASFITIMRTREQLKCSPTNEALIIK